MGASLMQPCRVYEEGLSGCKVLTFSGEEGVVVNNRQLTLPAESFRLTPCQQPRQQEGANVNQNYWA